MILATTLRQGGYTPEIFDLSVRPKRREELLARCRREPPLWIGFSALTPEFPAAVEVVRQVKSVDREIPCVLGGIHGSFLPFLSLAEGPFDAVVIGEAEDRVVALSALIAAGRRDYWSLPQIAASDAQGNRQLDATPVDPMDMTRVPFPDWRAVNPDDYQDRPWQLVKRGRRVAPVLTSRGCPFQCTFCANVAHHGRRFRTRTAGQVVDEMEWLVREFRVDEIQVADDNFNADLRHAKAVLAEMIRRALPVCWKPPEGMRLEGFDEEFLDLVVRSGGYQVGFGIESGCPEILRNINRQMDFSRATEILARYRRAGLSTFGFFILGLPGETEETLRRTLAFALRAPLDHVHVSLCVPYPGSAIFRDLDARGVLHHRWAEYRHFNAFPVSGLSGEALKRALRRFYLRFYGRPRQAWIWIREAWLSGFAAMARVGWAYLRNKRAW